MCARTNRQLFSTSFQSGVKVASGKNPPQLVSLARASFQISLSILNQPPTHFSMDAIRFQESQICNCEPDLLLKQQLDVLYWEGSKGAPPGVQS